jgi:teichuronic acid biosynthesis glycosyltransferase TuaC
MLRLLALSTLFPDATRPNFGIFVERQTLGLAAHPKISSKR